jgi:outer membrane protein TolC
MPRTASRVVLAVVSLLTLVAAPTPATAGGWGKSVGKAALARLWQQDLKNHAKAAVTPLAKPRTVHRYTTAATARREVKAGLGPNTHMTAGASAGRPLSAGPAQQKYGLPARPQVRHTIELPAGWPVRHTKVMGGAPGVGELTSPKALPPSAIRKTVPLAGGQ